jgi:peptidoglycan-associated lipoprotein
VAETLLSFPDWITGGIMQNKLHIIFTLFSIFLILVFMPACTKKEPPPSQPAPDVSSSEEDAAAAEKARQAEEARQKREAEASELRAGKIKFMYEDVYFRRGSYRLDAEAKTILMRKAEWLRNHPEIKVIIAGHTNNRGSKEYNFALGDRRAGEVKSFLINAGIPRERLVAVSYGNEKQIDSGNTEEARAKNRRVHFEFE